MKPNISTETQSLVPELVAVRRDIHRHPEQGFQETRTAALIEKKLKGWGVETKRVCKTGVVGLIRGARPGRTLLIRADMDGLPVREENAVPYRSRNEGVMHACGHDGHVAIGLMAARLLAKSRSALAGNVKFMFQPAEEGPGGARPMIEAGILEKPRVDLAFALHMWNDLRVGQIGVRSGPVFSSADEWKITVHGRGGHGAAPHQTIDPVVIASHVVLALQSIVSRKVDPVKSAVVTVGQIQGGNRFNIIPDSAFLVGTVRALEERVRLQVKREITRIASGVAASFGARAEVDYRDGYPVTVNDPEATALVRAAATAVVGKAGAVEQDVTLGAEDMAYVLREVPGCYFMLGSSNAAKGLHHPHHSPRFDFDEASLPIGVETWVRLARRLLA